MASGLAVIGLGVTACNRADERVTRRQVLDVRAAFERDGFTDIRVKRAVVVVASRKFHVSASGNVEKLSQQSADILAASDRLDGFIVYDESRAFPSIKMPDGFVEWSDAGGYKFQRIRR